MSYLPLTRSLACIATLAGAIAAAPAHALIITGSPSQTGAAFTADLTYTFDSTTSSANLVIDLQNTSAPVPVGGYLTAFVLNNPGGITSVSLTAAPTNFGLLGLDDDNVNGAPFGLFDFGATSDPSPSSTSGFEGGGNPNRGLAAGTGGTFTFLLEGSNLGALDETSFLGAFSVPPGAGQGTEFFVARFRGLDVAPDSDKVAAIPEPSTYAALLAGVGLLAWRMRRRLWG